MKLNKNNTIDPAQDPFVHLWLMNCVLYAVVAAFLIVKEWTRKNTSQTGKGKAEDKQKEIYERQAGEIRKNNFYCKSRDRKNKVQSEDHKKREAKSSETVGILQSYFGGGVSELHGKRKIQVEKA